MSTHRRFIGRLLGAALAVALSGFWALAHAQGAARNPAAELEDLIKAARAEGEVSFYFGPPENIAKRLTEAFTAKYGVKTRYLRMTSAPLLQRYSAEAESGNIAVDLMILAGNAKPYADEAIRKGWMEPLSQSDVPVIKAGTFPARFNNGSTAVVQVNPWAIGYNTDKVKGGDIPRDYRDILNPRFKGQIIIPDPRASDVYIDFWSLVLDKHGEAFFTQLRTQEMRVIDSGAPAIQALAAGEGSLMVPVILSLVQGLKDKGGPLSMVTMDHTTGSEMQVMMTARSKARHPNAGRLFANYVLSQEGNTVFNNDPGGFTVYDTSRLPRQFEFAKPETIKRKDLIVRLLLGK